MKMDKDKKAWVAGLCFKCPLGQERCDCPVRAIRPKRMEDRVKMVHGMTEEMIESHLRHHADCSAIRSSNHFRGIPA